MLDGKQVIVRRVMVPAQGPRPFMKPAFEEMREQIISGLQQATNEALSK
jgi:hypothetical protein